MDRLLSSDGSMEGKMDGQIDMDKMIGQIDEWMD